MGSNRKRPSQVRELIQGAVAVRIVFDYIMLKIEVSLKEGTGWWSWLGVSNFQVMKCIKTLVIRKMEPIMAFLLFGWRG